MTNPEIRNVDEDSRQIVDAAENSWNKGDEVALTQDEFGGWSWDCVKSFPAQSDKGEQND